MADTTTLYTTVKNPTPNPITYGYLGRHGKRLLGGATYTFLGQLTEQVRRGHGQSGRRQRALERDLTSGRIVVLSTPAPVYRNVGVGPKVFTVTGAGAGVLGTADPSWGAYNG